MKMTETQKHNLLEFLSRATLVGKEAVTLANLLCAISATEIIKEECEDGQLTKNV